MNWFTHIPLLPMVNACLGPTSGKRREDRTARKPRQFSYLTQGGNQMSDVAADKPGMQLVVSEHAGVWACFKRLFADPNYRLAAAVLSTLFTFFSGAVMRCFPEQ